MAVKTCPVKGYEKFTITIPNEWKVKHGRAWAMGLRAALEAKPEKDRGEVDVNTLRMYGCLALCEQVDNPPPGPVDDWPLAVGMWLLETVYAGNFEAAYYPPKNS